MLRKVLTTRKVVRMARSLISGHVQEGITILTSSVILFQKSESTFPLPPYIKGCSTFFFFLGPLSRREFLSESTSGRLFLT